MSDHNLKLASDAPDDHHMAEVVGASSDAAEQALAELRAKRAAIAERRAKREDDVQLQIAEESLALADEEAIERCELEHGPIGKKIAVIKTTLGVIVVKQSHHLKFKRFLDKGEHEYKDFDLLVRPCVVHPTLARFDEILTEQPAQMTRCAAAVSLLAGFRIEEVRSK